MSTAPDRLLRRLEWQVVRRLDGRMQGGYRTRATAAAGTDFAGLRAYVEGTTSGTSTGTSPPGWTSRTCGSTPRTAS